VNSEPLRLGSRKSPMAVARSGDVARLITEGSGRRAEIAGVTTLGDGRGDQSRGHKQRAADPDRRPVVLGLSAGGFQPAALDSAAASGRMVIRERGEAAAADAARRGRGLAARMLELGAADLMRAEKINGNDAHD
jgi:porphobilinogen deaminase